jgi:hypothetical protein
VFVVIEDEIDEKLDEFDDSIKFDTGWTEFVGVWFESVGGERAHAAWQHTYFLKNKSRRGAAGVCRWLPQNP